MAISLLASPANLPSRFQLREYPPRPEEKFNLRARFLANSPNGAMDWLMKSEGNTIRTAPAFFGSKATNWNARSEAESGVVELSKRSIMMSCFALGFSNHRGRTENA